MLRQQRFEVPYVRRLAIKCRVAVLEQRVESQHFGGIRLSTLHRAIGAVREQRYASCPERQSCSRARGHDDEIQAFGMRIRIDSLAITDPRFNAWRHVFGPDSGPASDALVVPALRRERGCQQLGEPVAIELVQVKLVT